MECEKLVLLSNFVRFSSSTSQWQVGHVWRNIDSFHSATLFMQKNIRKQQRKKRVFVLKICPGEIERRYQKRNCIWHGGKGERGARDCAEETSSICAENLDVPRWSLSHRSPRSRICVYVCVCGTHDPPDSEPLNCSSSTQVARRGATSKSTSCFENLAQSSHFMRYSRATIRLSVYTSIPSRMNFSRWPTIYLFIYYYCFYPKI